MYKGLAWHETEVTVSTQSSSGGHTVHVSHDPHHNAVLSGKDVIFELSEVVSGREIVADDEDAVVATEALSDADLPTSLPDDLREVSRT